MEVLYTIFDVMQDSLIIVYCIILMLAIYKFKEVNSSVICVAVLFCMECISDFIDGPLLSSSWEIWYGAWVVYDILVVLTLYKAHKLLKINLAKITNAVAFAYVIKAWVHTFRYIERSFFGGEHLDTWYYLAINSINISIVIIVIFTLLKDKEEKRVGLYI